ncbi:AMP-binding protein [Sodalis ligni]|uniref:AMP-binding protein n=1 Tax=Sodalis ligni TaxID=2697027 RepID=UPI00209824F9|nr:AMP-binding protein [Sodalis ligni]
MARRLSKLDLVRSGAMVGFLGPTGLDYVIAEYACTYIGAAIVPLPANIPSGDIAKIAGKAGIETVFTSVSCIDLLVNATRQNWHISTIILIGDASVRDIEDIRSTQIRETIGTQDGPLITDLRQLENDSTANEHSWQRNSAAEDSLRLILYTSGSTGLPKGVMFTEYALREYWKKALTENRGGDPELLHPMPQVDVGVSYMPQNHLMGQLNVIESIVRGGRLHFTTFGDMSSLLEDICLARPTTLTLVPRVAQAIYHAYQSGFAQQLRDTCRDRTEIEETLRYGLLGDRLMFMRTGTAPTGEEVTSFLQRAFEVPVYDMYGSTEAGYVSFENRLTSSVVTDHRLVDVPELGYLTSDTPFPRGELRIKTTFATAGYLHDKQATLELFDEDEFIRTGDIFEQRPNGEFLWIDRCSNIVKLAQGEFVSLWRLESLYVDESEIVAQLYLYADSRQDHIIGIVVPSAVFMNEHSPETGEMANENIIRDRLLAEFQRIAKQNNLKAYEIPRDVLIETTPFSRKMAC